MMSRGRGNFFSYYDPTKPTAIRIVPPLCSCDASDYSVLLHLMQISNGKDSSFSQRRRYAASVGLTPHWCTGPRIAVPDAFFLLGSNVAVHFFLYGYLSLFLKFFPGRQHTTLRSAELPPANHPHLRSGRHRGTVRPNYALREWGASVGRYP